jgi:hypothetical protein
VSYGRGTATTLVLVGPAREPASIRRWSPQRLMLTAAAALGTLILIGLFDDSLGAGPTERLTGPFPSGSAVAQFRVLVTGALKQGWD